jgi:hypothetical protein
VGKKAASSSIAGKAEPKKAKKKLGKESKAKTAKPRVKGSDSGEKKKGKAKPSDEAVKKIVVKHVSTEVPEGLPKKFLSKSTFNTHDIMHSPAEKTLKMIDKILSGERLFTM